MKQSPELRYLELLKKTLSFTLWPEPPVPVTTFEYLASPPVRFLITLISKILSTKKLELVRRRDFTEDQRINGQVWPGYADTMIGLKRLDNLQACMTKVVEDQIEGDWIETGVWRGGACIFMRAFLAVHGIENRKVFVADSFEGLPEPDDKKWPADKGDEHHVHSFLAVSRQQVENNFKKYSLLDDQVVFLQGWFKDTLPNAPIDKLSILRLDGDMYGSTMETLEALYPKLSKGGFCIIDDYGLAGCKSAIEDYRKRNGIDSELLEIDWTGRYWRKE